MSDEQTPAAVSDSGQQNPTAPQQIVSPVPAPPSGDPDGAGSKRQVLAELAEERKNRQALAEQINDMKSGFAKALGLTSDELTPEQLTQQLETARGETASMRTQLAVYSAAPTGVDVQALLDSAAFQRELAAKNPRSDTEIQTVISEYVTANPRFRTLPTGGAKDVHAGTAAKGASFSMDDFLRGNRRS